MQYKNIYTGNIINRENRFLANVRINGQVERVYVPNTGRCKELFVPNARVLLSKAEENSNRKTKYSLVHVEKNGRWINIDSQSPNRLVEEYLQHFPYLPGIGKVLSYKREVKQGNSRLDFAVSGSQKSGFIEVKGVTLERDGHAYFPDAPTSRGSKHVRELIDIKKQGQEAFVFFVIQMKGVHTFTPNWPMDPDFSQKLQLAQELGVEILAMDTKIEKEKMVLDKLIPIHWNKDLQIDKPNIDEMDEILEIYKQASNSLKEEGVDQWQEDKPDQNILAEDMKKGVSYVHRSDRVLATAALIPGQDETYRKIYKGKWKNEAPYTTIHRFAVNSSAQGQNLGKRMMQALFDRSFSMGFNNVRIDTHRDNKKMLGLIRSMGFIQCGIIQVADGSERIAFIKELR